MPQFVIYALSDPRTGEMRYVGKTESLLRVRYNHHLHRARQGAGHHIYCWMRKLLTSGVKPVLEVVEICNSHEELIEAEKFYISYFRALGFDLTNLTEGGEGCVGYKHSVEARKRMSAAKFGKKSRRVYEHKLSLEDIEDAVKQYTNGASATALATQLGVSRETVMKHLRRVGTKTRNAAQQRWESARG